MNGLRASYTARAAGDVSTYTPTNVITITDGVRRDVSGSLQPLADSSKEENKIEVVLIESLLRLSNGSQNYIYVKFGCSGCYTFRLWYGLARFK